MLPPTRAYIIRSLVLTLLLGLSLYYLADFSLRQSAALVLLVWLFQFLINDIWRVKSEEGSQGRFLVIIRPNWCQILLDHRLIADKQDWQQVMERAFKRPSYEYCVLRDGITFTVLEANLLYLNNERKFVEKIHLDIEIPEVMIPQPNSLLGEPFSPSIVVEQISSFTAGHPTWGGYQFGLVTPECMESTWAESRQEPIRLAFLTTLEFSGHEIRPLG